MASHTLSIAPFARVCAGVKVADKVVALACGMPRFFAVSFAINPPEKMKMNRLFKFSFWCVCLAAVSSAYAGGKVLVVHSYHEGFDWVDMINVGLKKALVGTDAQIEYVCMDTKRNSQLTFKEKAGLLAKEKVASFQPDVVITSDDIAQQFFAKDYVNKPGPKFVFCGMNAELDAYGYPGNNTYGILERPHTLQSLQLLLQIAPKVKTIGLLSDDTETSTLMVNQIQATKDIPVKIVAVERPVTFAEWQVAVQKLQGSVDAVAIILYQAVKKEAGGKSMEPKEVISWTLENLKKPTVGFFDWSMKAGVTCGIAESGEEHGYEAGLMAKALLNGQKPAEPVKIAKKGTVILNAITAQKVGLEIPFDVIQSADMVIDK